MSRICLILAVFLMGTVYPGRGQLIGRIIFSNFSYTNGAFVTNLCTGQLVPQGSNFLAGLYLAPDGERDECRFISAGPPGSAA
jgi:hypothetical protein